VKRRSFIAGLGSVAAWPVVASGQQAAVPVIGILASESLNDGWRELLAAFHHGLADTGYFEGRNVTIEYRWADNQNDRLPAMATDLVRRQVSVIVASGTAAALVTKAATTTIPIVFAIGTDPVKFNIVASLARPGANVTGISQVTNALVAKNLELLHEVAPNAAVVGMLIDPANPNAKPDAKEAQAAANALGLRLLVLNANNQSDIEAAFANLAEQHAGALLVSAHTFFVAATDQIVALAARDRVPTMYFRHEFTTAGGLMSYGANNIETFRLVGVYTGRVLKGEKPAELPVQQPAKFSLVLNLRTARAIGLTIPPKLLAFADEVIE
jgi:putative tryptophan/tyrosine transport system substrate-binding protein